MTAPIILLDEGDPAVLTVDEVAAELRVSSWTIYQRIKDGSLRSIRVGRLIRVPRVALDEFLGSAAS